MSAIHTLLRQLESHVQEESGAQARMLALLERQEQALRGPDAALLLETTQALDVEIEGSSKRAVRRDELVQALASAWGTSGRALTLSSICERSGDEGERLSRLRGELESVARRVQKLARRTGTAARIHERITNDALRSLLDSEARKVDHGGAIVDAEA